VSRYVAIAIRLAIGAAGALALAFLTGRLVGLFPENENRDLFVFARFALLALWVTLGAPWVFKAARLSESNVIHYQEDE
ncbi:MAG: hypothetical protein FWE09_09795, partial [Treponema sp.]|nr:hypothetical protein [Treponema sp.]